MSYYAPSIPGSVVSQPTSQALVLANTSARAVQYPASGYDRYMCGSYPQPVQYGYPQSMPVYVQPQQQQVVYTMPTNVPTYAAPASYGYGMQMATTQYVPGMGMQGGTSVIVQDPYYRRRSRRRRHSYSGYPPYGY